MDQLGGLSVAHKSVGQFFQSDGDARNFHKDLPLHNSYGSSYLYQPDLFRAGSCTCSTVSEPAFLSVVPYLQKDFGKSGSEIVGSIRRRLGHLYELSSEDGEIHLTHSGTDAEILVSALTLLGTRRSLCNFIAQGSEVGRGSANASACRHFDTISSMGNSVEPSTEIGLATDQVETLVFPLRKPSGERFSCEEIESSLEQQIAQKIAAGSHALLHVIDHSKTGIAAPSYSFARRMKRTYGEHLDVVVDAAQGRLSRGRVKQCLKDGFVVFVTGSKYFGGPSFSGAVLIPPGFFQESQRQLSLDLNGYFSGVNLGERVAEALAVTNREPTPGLWHRWLAALHEMEAYYGAPSEVREGALLKLSQCFQDFFQHTPNLITDIVFNRYGETEASKGALEALPTVFPFFFTDFNDSKKSMKAEMNDVRTFLMKKEGSKSELGQAVDLGTETPKSTLRLAIGAPLVNEVMGAYEEDRTIDLQVVVKNIENSVVPRLETLSQDLQQAKKQVLGA